MASLGKVGLISAFLLGAGAITTSYFWPQDRASVPAHTATPEASIAPEPPSEKVPAANAPTTALLDNYAIQLTPQELPPELQNRLDQYEALFNTQHEFRQLLQDAAAMDTATLATRFDEMEHRIAGMEKADQISAAEALLMRLAMVQVSAEPGQAGPEMQRLINRYQEQHEVRMMQHKQRPDVRFSTYKDRETAILKEVMEMQHYPDGLSREDYLAKRLQAARSEIWATQEGGQTDYQTDQ